MFFVGDSHGDWDRVLIGICKYGGSMMNLIIVGDTGNGYAPWAKDMETLEEVNDNLKVYDTHVWVCRGNHDDPKYFDGRLDDKFSHLHFMKDYEEKVIEGQNVLFVGGAFSIDRAMRIMGKNCWEDEIFVLKETDAEPDIVVTHTAPAFCNPPAHFDAIPILGTDERFDAQFVVQERLDCTKLYEQLKKKPQLWVYGHFHQHYFQKYDDTEFRGLAIMEFHEYRKGDLD